MFSFIFTLLVTFRLQKPEQQRVGFGIKPYRDRIYDFLKNERISEHLSGNILEYIYDQFIVGADQEGETMTGKWPSISNNIIVEILREAWSPRRSANDGIIQFRSK